MDLLVLAKEPRAGRVKTRLCPPCSPQEAAELAAAALADTLDAAVRSGADRVLLALDGHPGAWCPPGVLVVAQGTGPLDRRLVTTWTHASGPALQVGMDTPQVTAGALAAAMATLDRRGIHAVFGPALDGGWWCVGMTRPDPLVFLGIPTSRADTGRRQRAALVARGWAVADLPRVRDVDTWRDVEVVAAEAQRGRFAAAVRRCAEQAA